MGHSAPYIVGWLSSVVALGYFAALVNSRWQRVAYSYVAPLMLSLGLFMIWAISNALRELFRAWLPNDPADGLPWAWLPLLPMHFIILAGALKAAWGRSGRRWAAALATVALGVLLADAWFWQTWWPMKHQPYSWGHWYLFNFYNEVRNWAITAELVLVATPGVFDGLRALTSRAGGGVAVPADRRRSV